MGKRLQYFKGIKTLASQYLVSLFFNKSFPFFNQCFFPLHISKREIKKEKDRNSVRKSLNGKNQFSFEVVEYVRDEYLCTSAYISNSECVHRRVFLSKFRKRFGSAAFHWFRFYTCKDGGSQVMKERKHYSLNLRHNFRNNWFLILS